MDDLRPGEWLLPPPNLAVIVSEEGRVANLRSWFNRGKTRFFDAYPGYDIQKEPIAIVGGGPSLNKTLPQLRKHKGPIMACGSAHNTLRKRGIVPQFAVNLDPDKRMAEFFTEPSYDTIYLIASTSDPGLFDHFEHWGVKVLSFHATSEAERSEFRGEDGIAGGTTVATRAWMVAWLMGYRKFVFFGVDSCFASTEEQNADPNYPDKTPYYFKVRVIENDSNSEFLTSVQMAQQAKDFMSHYCWASAQSGVKIQVKGHSLTREYVRIYERHRDKYEQLDREKIAAAAAQRAA